MEIISHRGYWLSNEEKNSPDAFIRSFISEFGTETDFRDRLGEIVISHDPSVGGEMLLTDLLLLTGSLQPTLALNVKADGLALPLMRILEHFEYANYFVFDMSGPEYLSYKNAGHPTYARVSELEQPDLEVLKPDGIWLDGLMADRWRIEWLKLNAPRELRVAIVSPELHGRDHKHFWDELKVAGISKWKNIMLCTDYPNDARNFFGATVD